MYISLHLDGDVSEMGPILDALKNIQTNGKTPVVVVGDEKEIEKRKRRTADQIAADKAKTSQPAETKDSQTAGDPIVNESAETAAPEEKTQPVTTEKEISGPDMRAVLRPVLDRLKLEMGEEPGKKKMMETLEAFGVDNIEKLTQPQRAIYVAKLPTYTKDSDAKLHFASGSETPVPPKTDEFEF